MAAHKKTMKVNLRMDPSAHGLISRAADVCGKNITEFMTEAAVYSAQNELLEQRFIGVPSDVFDAVDSRLSKPGVARDQLVKLFESNVDWMD